MELNLKRFMYMEIMNLINSHAHIPLMGFSDSPLNYRRLRLQPKMCNFHKAIILVVLKDSREV
jgi:hypothetical protein